MNEQFRFINPFLSISVNEDEIWAEEENGFQDIETINQGPFKALTDDIIQVKKDPRHNTRVRFLVGNGGSGKSHLFSRLRRRMGHEAIFTFASNPPTRAEGILSWVLSKVIGGLKHPCLNGEVKPYTQLHGLLYELLRDGFRFNGTLDEFHEAAQADPEAFFSKAQHYLVTRQFPHEPDLARILAHVLHPERSELAFRWLAGSTNLIDQELVAIEQREPLPEEMKLQILSRVGRATVPKGTPIVLVLDQLDLMTQPALVDAFQHLFFALIDESKHWYLVVSLIDDKFDFWKSQFSTALRDRLEEPLPVVALQPLGDIKEKEALIKLRLATPELVRLRIAQGINNPLYPLGEADIRGLVEGEPLYPRQLLRQAKARYSAVTSGQVEKPVKLGAEIETAFDKARAKINENELEINKDILADRFCEVLEVLCAAEGRAFESHLGPLASEANFRGTDTLLKIDGCEMRLLGHHIHQGAQFPNFMKKVMPLPLESVLIRDGKVPISGKVTSQRLTEFQKDKIFIHLPRPEIGDAYALGEVLASLREQEFAGLNTDPPPTPENIKQCLGEIPKLAHGQVAKKVLALVNPHSASVSASTPPLPPMAIPTQVQAQIQMPPQDLVKAIRALMESDRWLIFERLRRRLKTIHHLEVTPEELRAAIASEPLCHDLLRYPEDTHTVEETQILIWSVEEAYA
ncbi:hypothetical protein Nhal_1463 [Nitrosococcus halophilus Nc 4]|uniref:Orc1-like AAA ATPase domain-containing protein n=1 Tax=Nitrosococcus halophilus (strain Nc4) TaxID=472759 RepID=D5C157_NITHN|nr:hypothetical protein [Nitrosococcus halophilus]ADE14614.1 hypothetical protein Nhal_1463 [Nitrosococcus halophilus Nc 4]